MASIKERSPEVHLFIEMPPDARRRQRASDEGGGALPRSVAGARGRAARADGRAGAERACRSCSCGPSTPQRMSRSRPRCPACSAGGAYPNRWMPQRRSLASDSQKAPRHELLSVRPLDACRSAPASAGPSTTPDIQPDDPARASSATRSSSRSTTRVSRSSTSTSRTSACCSSA